SDCHLDRGLWPGRLALDATMDGARRDEAQRRTKASRLEKHRRARHGRIHPVRSRASAFHSEPQSLRAPIHAAGGAQVRLDGEQDARCDFKGQPLDRAPKWVITLVPSIRIPLATLAGFRGLGAFAAETALTARMTGQYKDVHFISLTRDPRGRQPAFFRFGA